MRPAWNLVRSRAALALSAGAFLCLANSCTTSHGKAAKDHQAAKPAASTGQPGQPGQAVAPNDAAVAAAAQPVAHYVTSARVEDSAPPAEGPSPGRELIAHAIADAAEPQKTESSNSNSGGVPVASAERRVGVVRIIGAHRKFVLIETTTGYGGVPLGEGQELLCRGPAANGGAQTAVLAVSREREAPYLVADVAAGAPQAGDVAYFTMPKPVLKPVPKRK